MPLLSTAQHRWRQQVRQAMHADATLCAKRGSSAASWEELAREDTLFTDAYEGDLATFERELDAIAQLVWHWHRRR